jgi:hypothetical protein
MKRNITIITTLLISLILSACSTKIEMNGIKPSLYDKAAKTKKIAVVNFNNDNISQAEYIEEEMNSYIFNNKKYFTMANRLKINEILEEQKFNKSGYIKEEEQIKLGEILGVNSIITGGIKNINIQSSKYKVRRTNYNSCVEYINLNKNKRVCQRYANYYITCESKKYYLNTNISILNIETSENIYIKNFKASYEQDKCPDQYKNLLSNKEIFDNLSKKISSEFVKEITPKYYKYEVEILENPDIDYTEEEEELLEASIELIKQNRLERASVLISKLIKSTKSKSYVALYLKGVIKESNGNLEEARKLYKESEYLTIKPIKEISKSLNRINLNIYKKKIAYKQINS